MKRYFWNQPIKLSKVTSAIVHLCNLNAGIFLAKSISSIRHSTRKSYSSIAMRSYLLSVNFNFLTIVLFLIFLLLFYIHHYIVITSIKKKSLVLNYRANFCLNHHHYGAVIINNIFFHFQMLMMIILKHWQS